MSTTVTTTTSYNDAPDTAQSTDLKDTTEPVGFLQSILRSTSAAAGKAASNATGVVVGATSAAVQGGAELAASTASRTMQTGQAAVEIAQGAAVMLVGAAAKGTTDSLKALTKTIGQSSGVAVDVIGQRFADLITNAGTVVTGAGGTLSSAVDTLAGDPSAPQSIHMQGLRIAVGLLPVVGNAKAIGDARQKYKQALALPEGEQRDLLMNGARRDCLIASSLLSIEVATVGASGAVDKALKGSTLLGSILNAGKTVREVSQSQSWLPKVNVDILSPQVDLALRFPPLREAMDIILRFDSEAAGA